MDRATVLVVEDNATTRKMMRVALGGEDLRVVEAAPILALTGLLSRADEARVAAAGFTDLLIKPVEPSLLRRVVASYLAVEPAAGRPPALVEPKRILLVDDDPVQLKLAGLRLGMVGYLVTTAADGAEAPEP